MTEKDHLEGETSLSVGLSEDGVTAKAKSRTIAAIDRLGGNLVDALNVRLEEKTEVRRARLDGEIKLIETTVKYAQERMEVDHPFAQRILENQLKKLVRAQQNKDGVLTEALEDLRREPPHPDEANSGPEEISSEFMERFEFYAEGATTDQLRERWGRVLASEIRKPGTFSVKVLRVIDEIDAETAQLFEQVCSDLLSTVLIKELSGEISFNAAMKLVNAGLLVDPGIGHIRTFAEQTDVNGTEVWCCYLGRWALAYPKDSSIEPITYFQSGNPPSFETYILTDAGSVISSILKDNQDDAFLRLYRKLRQRFDDNALRALKVAGDKLLDVTDQLYQ